MSDTVTTVHWSHSTSESYFETGRSRYWLRRALWRCWGVKDRGQPGFRAWCVEEMRKAVIERRGRRSELRKKYPPIRLRKKHRRLLRAIFGR